MPDTFTALLFMAGEDGKRPFKNHQFSADNLEAAKKQALDWACEAKPAHYTAVDLWLKQGETVVWKAPLSG